ncbi:MAG TPA: right-handed parallel beta-helix repeat-containing protein [Pyrinomonadaceae bacterium]|nr:right-handed parallel beta-helix repeat-containing protein [Pyrinomonadaceae bacterium]
MKGIGRAMQKYRWIGFLTMLLMALVGASFLTGRSVSANHPVLVEGNCDSPVPGQTTVTTSPSVGGTSGGICGDFDGDGRVGTAEDTDGADRIFGTLAAALGPGTGAAAGTGANQNGSITIVESGRFAESLTITASPGTAGPGGQGTVVIQAAPGVEATIDAQLQGDPAGNNGAREATVGLFVNASTNSRVILRNLRIRNFAEGIRAVGNSNLVVEDCRLESNLFYGIRMLGNSRVGIVRTSVIGTGYRVSGSGGNCPSAGCTPFPAHGIAFEEASSGTVAQSHLSGNFGVALINQSSLGATAVSYYEVFLSNNGGGGVSNATKVNF